MKRGWMIVALAVVSGGLCLAQQQETGNGTRPPVRRLTYEQLLAENERLSNENAQYTTALLGLSAKLNELEKKYGVVPEHKELKAAPGKAPAAGGKAPANPPPAVGPVAPKAPEAPAAKTFTSWDNLFAGAPPAAFAPKNGWDELHASQLNTWLSANVIGSTFTITVSFDHAGQKVQQEDGSYIPVTFAPGTTTLNGSELTGSVNALCEEKQMGLILKIPKGAIGVVTGKITKAAVTVQGGKATLSVSLAKAELR